MTFGRTITIKTIQIPHVIDTKVKSIPTTDYTPLHSNLSPLFYFTSPDIYLLTLPSTPTHQSTDLASPLSTSCCYITTNHDLIFGS